MQVISVNVSQPKEFDFNGKIVQTGIFKDPVQGHVMMNKLNIEGDGQADLRNHGGRYKAVYVYPHEHYQTWQSELNRDDFSFGQLGENLTVEGLLETDVYVGNVYRVGEALVQVTQPRVPCFKLGIRMNDPTFVKKFMQAERTGFYVQVLEEGLVGAGDEITLERESPQKLSVRDINHLLYFEQDVELAKKALEIESLSRGWRKSFREMIETLPLNLRPKT